jgi:enoyl-CoA hydratase
MPDTLQFDVDGRVATVTLDRPDVLNAINAEMGIELDETFAAIDADDDIDVARIDGRGDSFSSGFDLNELKDDMGGMSYDHFERHAEGKNALQDLSRTINRTDTVVVSAVRGNTLGAGLELAVISDIAIVAESATIGFPETDIGLSITNGVTNLLPRAIGLQRAKRLVLTGETISGQEAVEMGLLADAVPEDDLDDRVDEVVEAVLSRTPSGTAAAKELLNAGREVSYEESLQRELNAGLALLRTEEYQRALSEFFE